MFRLHLNKTFGLCNISFCKMRSFHYANYCYSQNATVSLCELLLLAKSNVPEWNVCTVMDADVWLWSHT
jgi:hypothetical protein